MPFNREQSKDEADKRGGFIPADTKGELEIERYYTREGANPYDDVEWKKLDAQISNEKGEIIFEQKDVEAPSNWSQMAVNVVVSKYFAGGVGLPGRETSVRQLVGRVVDTITGWGEKDGYFESKAEAQVFGSELTYLLLNQYAAFNSPVWFNVGIEPKPQCSACFINSIEDSMESILKLARTEGMLFKYGSGAGTNLSPLRASKERLQGGGFASGPVSFMRGYDAFAGVIKSGGKTRRAAKMVMLDIDHPDIEEFINCKANEEKKAWALIDAGYSGDYRGEAYSSVFFQNGNNSVRVTDEFMQAVLDDREWQTIARTTKEPMDTYKARDLLKMMAESAHLCGDPGIQFDTTINDWNPCSKSGRINASNPCSEYMFLNDSACNLASLNLLKFVDARGEFDVDGFIHAVRIIFTSQEIIVDNASYPTEKIEANSHKFRPIGLGFANLGALLMSMGLPYDSEEGRQFAAAVSSLMGGSAYLASSELASRIGPFSEYEKNREPFMRVLRKHRLAGQQIDAKLVPDYILAAAQQVWDDAIRIAEVGGLRNAQATVIAPTGTIAFMMDCDTTGIEPEMALVKYKKLAGGGMLKIVNHTVPRALQKLHYETKEIEEIVAFIDDNDTIEGAPHIKEEHLPVFDCAFRPMKGERAIHYMGHIKMMAAVQPFVSGAISKTVNMPSNVTTDDIARVYIEAWKLGLKAIAIYRENSKRSQPLSTLADDEDRKLEPRPIRRRLPDERASITHKFSINAHEGYITVGMYEDGQPGEIFIVMAKEGSTISGLMDTIATMTSIMLQYGVPLKVLISKFCHTRFEPSGWTNNKEIPFAKSIVDYLFRWVALKFLGKEHMPENGDEKPGTDGEPSVDILQAGLPLGEGTLEAREVSVFNSQAASSTCPECGSIMIQTGSCHTCPNCLYNEGCG
ncbi:vitamin B12-dependent ribonucleotide reductase [bacterium]|nr:vitamin B12-dependent ribonucleotide reductase [bacterium]